VLPYGKRHRVVLRWISHGELITTLKDAFQLVVVFVSVSDCVSNSEMLFSRVECDVSVCLSVGQE